MNSILKHLIETFLWPSINTPNTISDLGPWSSRLFPELTIDQWTIRAVSVVLSPLSTQSSIKSSTIGRTLGQLIRLSFHQSTFELPFEILHLTYTVDVECKAVVQIKTINLRNSKLLSRPKFGKFFSVLLVKCIEKRTHLPKKILRRTFLAAYYIFLVTRLPKRKQTRM